MTLISEPSLYAEELSLDDAAGFAALYALYADLFPLPDEREPPEAFYEILALNQNAEVQQRLGPWREIVAAVRLGVGGPVVGGHVFGATSSRAHLNYGCGASVQGIYTFFDNTVRGRTSMADIRNYFEREALRVFSLNADALISQPLIFIEVNNPLRMTAEEIADDTLGAGIDPFRRYMFWQRSGFTPLDFPYVQPRLRPDAQPVRYLDLFCSSAAQAIPAAVVANHLRAFIAISVLKGKPADEDPEFAAMQAWLAATENVSMVPATRADQQKIREQARANSKAATTDKAAP